jgi:hypothetical protein
VGAAALEDFEEGEHSCGRAGHGDNSSPETGRIMSGIASSVTS